MRRLKANLLLFYHCWLKEAYWLLIEWATHVRDSCIGLIVIPVLPFFLVFKFFRDLIQWREIDEEGLDRFFSDPKKYSVKMRNGGILKL